MDFLHAFEAIDSDFSGEITTQELEAFCRLHNYQDSFVEKWLQLFDQDHTGVITIENYCETLGLVPKQEYMQKVQSNRVDNPVSGVMDGVKVITEDPELTDAIKEEMVGITRRVFARDCANERDLARLIKTELDTRFGRAWHVVAGRFQFGSYCTHEMGSLFHFSVLGTSILLWKTPDF